MPETMTGQPMEEILASIKRIIAEDAPLSLGVPTLGNPPEKEATTPEDEVLELEAPASPSLAEPAQAPPGWRSADVEATDPALQVEPAPASEEPREYYRGQPVAAAPSADYVTAAATLEPEAEPTVAAAVPAPVAHLPEPVPALPDPEPAAPPPLDPAVLAAALDPEPAYEGLLSASAEAASRQALAALGTLTIDSRAAPNTLDGMVREMVRPMVKDWLDKNLPSLVEQLVAKEIKRLARG